MKSEDANRQRLNIDDDEQMRHCAKEIERFIAVVSSSSSEGRCTDGRC